MKKMIFLSIVDISKRNGQGIYSLKILEAFIRSKKYFIDIVLPVPTDLSVLDNLYNENSNIHFLKKKEKERSVIWHFIIQIQILFKLLNLRKSNFLLYSLKPSMITPVVFSIIFKIPIYLLVEGLAKKSINKVIPRKFRSISLKILEFNIRNAKSVYPAYESAKRWVDEIRSHNDSEIIPCGVDTCIFKPVSSISNDKLVLGYVGSFRKEHLLINLIKAIEDLDVQLLLVGSGIEENYIKNYVDINNLKNKVLLLGTKSQPELPEFFKKCDVLISLTDINHWGVPIKGFEYLACNKKIIFTYKEDLEFIKENNFGYILESNEILDIKNVIDKIIEDKRKLLLHDNKNSSEFIRINNNWDNFPKKILID